MTTRVVRAASGGYSGGEGSVRKGACRLLTLDIIMLRASLAALARQGTTRPAAQHICHAATWTQRRTNSTASRTLPSVCPSCSAPLPTTLPACPKCRHISLVPKDLPKHELFGLSYDPNPFDIDDAALKGAFRNLQRVIHPDLWSGSDHVRIRIRPCMMGRSPSVAVTARNGSELVSIRQQLLQNPQMARTTRRIHPPAQRS